jgi:small subunit ribosomal protein S24e
MDVEIVEDRENTLLRRREVRFKASYHGPTPTRQEARSKLVAVLTSDGQLTVLDKLESEYGAQTAVGYVKVYADKDAMKVEPEYVLERNFEVKEKAAPAEGGGGEAAAPAEGGQAPQGEGAESPRAAEEGEAKAGDADAKPEAMPKTEGGESAPAEAPKSESKEGE